MKHRETMSRFSRFATWASHTSGHPSSFIFALAIIVVWAATGPIFRFSDTWQLVINTGTTIITFLMVFVIQNTQNRDSAAIQLKLDEIIRSLDGANNALLNMEELDEKDLEAIRQSYLKLAQDARNALREGRKQEAAAPPSV
ncbi:low affinity iron permease family protein [Geomonas nitrogeniifigens]|uniref:Low affinity iron permease family protein n=1 Tax=Geomonas diazotrophica TaxID=2843197 RepID=A0ABX8JMZ1_9BACT|nr:low affinity iron permease family protein [Geomonas nitrogeniifigens]QWV97977.1 low affinity iron permease family protein [Geomonas nitrogeniifigens]